MNVLKNATYVGLLLVVVLAFVGCGRKPRGTEGPTGTGLDDTELGGGVSDIGSDIPLDTGTYNLDGPREPIPELQTVYFDFDKYNLRPDAVAALDQNAAWLLANSKVVIEIQGHCDERGSEQYNQALGERRALSVREYLVEKGVDSRRIVTKSFGKMQPVIPNARTEDEHQKNRRAVFMRIRQDSV